MARFTLRSILRDLDDGEPDTPQRAVEWMLEHERDLAAKMLLPTVRAEFSRMQRMENRALEDHAYHDGNPFDDKPRGSRIMDLIDRPAYDPVAIRKRLLDSVFWSPLDEDYVKWGEATAAQHRGRARKQRSLSRAVAVDAERHEDAARRIEKAQVRCLNDLHDMLAVAR